MPVTDARPLSKCGTCGQTDNAPKLQVAVGVSETSDGFPIHHPHDFDKNGCVYYHMDCESLWHEAVINGGNDAHAAIVEVCKSGVQNDDLYEHILSGGK